MAKLAVILYDGTPTRREESLYRILEFLGVPCRRVEISTLEKAEADWPEYAILGSAPTVAAVLMLRLKGSQGAPRLTAAYAYSAGDREATRRALTSLTGCEGLSLQDAPSGEVAIQVSKECADSTGPMAGVKFSSPLAEGDAEYAGVGEGSEAKLTPIVSAGGAPVFLHFQFAGLPVYASASSQMVDIDQTLDQRYYDVKPHFCSIVPLVMFIKHAFREAAWRPQEWGACLIVDDPLLRGRYGWCDFGRIRDLMQQRGFTTNIAFIPWNWRRTSRAAGDFFRKESGRFSISIHGCDHTGGEFGTTSPEILENRARLAQSRMQGHEARTGIHHDRIMVFPQGVFSSACPEVLKRNGYLAAVNTEPIPVDPPGARTRIRDVWDVAIMSYGGFPIFTRRYPFHGLENFAFDLLLGKPCLTVSHHEFFRDGAVRPVEWVEELRTLNCTLQWRPLGEVIKRACRRRMVDVGLEDVEMYGNEVVITNPSVEESEVRVRKREAQAELVSEVSCDAQPIRWSAEDGYLVFGAKIAAGGEKCFQVSYRERPDVHKVPRSLLFETKVAARRFLSEFRDDYVSRSRFLTATTGVLKKILVKGK